MDKAIYMAVNSIKADKIKQINAVHEVANVSTVGFKKAFDLTVETYRVDQPGSFTSRFLLTPEELGVVDLMPGSRMATGQPLDIFIEGDGVLGEAGRHPRGAGHAQGKRAGAGLDQQRVGVAVVAALELHDLVAVRVTAGEADGAHGGFGARVDHAHHVHVRHDLADAVGELRLELGRRAEGQPLLGLAHDGLAHLRRGGSL